MPTLIDENKKNIRESLDVFVNIQQLQNTTLTVSASGYNVADFPSLQTAEIDLMPLTDLNGHGFPLDGSHVLYNPTVTASVDGGKVGIRSNVGEPMTLTVSANVVINALTFRVFGNGTISHDGVDYEIREFVVVPINSRNATITVTPDEGERVSVEDITPGITLEFDKTNLIRCELDLESDLDAIEGSWPISSIEVQGYYPDDISEAVSNMGDGVPIIYWSGYPGDYSTARFFYISEAVTQSGNLITIKGEDASSRLDNYTQSEEMWKLTRQTVRRGIYNKMATFLQTAGINLVGKEAAPPTVGTNTTATTVMLKDATYRDYIQFFMNITNKNGFFPRFIDAGLPTLRWSPPTPKWDIYKKDIGEFQRDIDRNVNKLYGDDKDLPIHSVLQVATKKTTIDTKNVTAGENYNIDYGDDYYYSPTWTNGTLIEKTVHSLKLKAEATTTKAKVTVISGWAKKSKKYKKGSEIHLVQNNVRNVRITKSKNYIKVTWEEPKYTTKTVSNPQMVVKGYKVTALAKKDDPNKTNVVTSPRLGITKEIRSLFWGRFLSNIDNSSYYIPKFDDYFNRSNIGGSFIWKGNPKMQPRDVFRLYELDGETYTVCTVQSIEMTHEGGGLSCKITYREGIY